jgi:hypothetical protein
MRRLFRLAHGGDNFLLPNLKIHTEVVIDPQGGLGIQGDTTLSLEGFPKRVLKVGLGLPGWGEGFQYSRGIVSEFQAALAAIDPELVPNQNDIFIAFLDPVSFYKFSTANNSFILDPLVSSAPQCVSAFPGLKILLVGDTHHGLLSLQNALAYCQQEAWDAFLLCHEPSHIDWFRAVLGDDRVFHLHHQISADELGLVDLRKQSPVERQYQELTFHGDFSHLHPRRSAIHTKLLNIRPVGIYRHVSRLPAQEWMQMLPCEAFVLTGCLNNQFSSYQLLTMLNGCLLFSDRFHTASGWGKLFKDGESYVLYENTEDLLELYRYYRRNPEATTRIASRGREIVESFFSLDIDSHSWLLADSPEVLWSELRSSTIFLEGHSSDPVRWSSLSQLKEDLAVYQLLNDLCVFYPSIRWVIGDRDSASLIQAVLQQIPRCLVSQMLLGVNGLEVSPVVMTRIPTDRELMLLGKINAACMLVLLRPDEFSSEGQAMLPDLENRLRAYNVLSWEWLGNQVQRNNLGIQLKARLTPNASWPLPTGWQALLIWDVEQLAKISPLY